MKNQNQNQRHKTAGIALLVLFAAIFVTAFAIYAAHKTATPATTTVLETTDVPETAGADEAMRAPEATEEFEATVESEMTEESETTAAPETTGEPETTEEPETTGEPETTAAPETTGEPEMTAGPETTAEPETTAAPVTTEAATPAASEKEKTVTYKYAVYLGVKGYGTVKASNKDSFVHRFSVDGTEMQFTVATGASENYAIQNTLAEGYVYDLTVTDGIVTRAVESMPLAEGKLASVSADAIVVGMEQIAADEKTDVYEITAAAGGAQVTAAGLAAGESVKVYGDGAADVIYLDFVAETYESPVDYTAGKTTLKNFLAAAMQPVGTALYVYGGAWNWQDTGSGIQATTIGLSKTWIDFFQSQDAGYRYKNTGDYSRSYYPHNSWNQYYYAGLDCSGYVAWAIYNTMNTESGGEGYVTSSTKMARTLAESYGFGTWTHTTGSSDELTPGDIISIKGHVWICLGVCDDGSVVILHSTPSKSREGYAGGGVQISGLGTSGDCEAAALAKKYMSTYYPEWSTRYEAVCKSFSYYTSASNSNAGRFSWFLGDGGVLTDPDGYASMSAEEILEDLFY